MSRMMTRTSLTPPRLLPVSSFTRCRTRFKLRCEGQRWRKKTFVTGQCCNKVCVCLDDVKPDSFELLTMICEMDPTPECTR